MEPVRRTSLREWGGACWACWACCGSPCCGLVKKNGLLSACRGCRQLCARVASCDGRATSQVCWRPVPPIAPPTTCASLCRVQEVGYNAFEFRLAYDCWARDVGTVNADNALVMFGERVGASAGCPHLAVARVPPWHTAYPTRPGAQPLVAPPRPPTHLHAPPTAALPRRRDLCDRQRTSHPGELSNASTARTSAGRSRARTPRDPRTVLRGVGRGTGRARRMCPPACPLCYAPLPPPHAGN